MSTLALPIANKLSLHQLAEAMAQLEVASVDYGTVLARPGETDPTVVYVLSGELEVVVDDVQLGTTHRGNVIGHAQMFGGEPWPGLVKASRPSELLIVSTEAYEALRTSANPVAWAIERAVLTQLAEDLRALDERISHIAEGEEVQRKPPPRSLFGRLRDSVANGGSAVVSSARGVLRSSDLFRDGDPEVVGALGDLMTMRRYRARDVIVAEGQPPDQLLFLAEGRVDVLVATGRDTWEPVATLDAGTLLGTTSLLEGRPHAASCVAREEIVVLGLDAEAFSRVVVADRPVGTVLRRALIRALIHQNRLATEQVWRLDAWLKAQVREEVSSLYVTPAGVEPATPVGQSRIEKGSLVLPPR